MTRLVVFDVDGTLVDSQHLILDAMAHAFKAAGQPMPAREAVLGIVVLVVTSLLVNTVPARDAYDTPYSVTLQAEGVEGDTLTVLLDIDSTRRGLTAMHLYSYTSYGDAQPFVQAQATFTEKAKGLGPVKVDLPALTPGHGYADALLVPSAGTWTVSVRVLTDDTHAFTATTTYRVRG